MMAPFPLGARDHCLALGDLFASLRSQGIDSHFANLRPILEFFDLERLSKPATFAEVQSQVNYNLSYFSSNYAVVFVMLGITVCSLISTLLLFV
jgi:PRA1 family protein 1